MKDRKSHAAKSSRKSARGEPQTAPWVAPLALNEVPKSGRHIELRADAATREAVAEAVGVAAILKLEADFDVTPLAQDGVRLDGVVKATVEQTCVVTLDPITNEVEAPVDLTFVPPGDSLPPSAEVTMIGSVEDDPPEVLHGGTIDLGAIATEFLALGIDPYPRKPGASFEREGDRPDPTEHPFAVLAALKKDGGPKSG